MTTEFPLHPQAVVLPFLALLALVLEIPPLIWHLRNRNLAATGLMFWIIVSNMMNFINPLIWPRDNIDQWWHGQGLCDVEVKIMVASWIGVIGSLLCILRNLAGVLNTEKAVMCLSKTQRQRKLAIELFLCVGLPVWMMIAHYIVQPNRFYIFAISGCTVSVDNSWPKFILLFVWPLIFSLVVIYYCGIIVLRMHRYRREFSTILSSSSADLTKHRFLRLFIMAATLVVVILPVQIYILYENSTVPLLPYSWDLVHMPSDWNQEILYPTNGSVIFDRWIQVSFGFLMFFFFGIGQDARDMYRSWLLALGLGRLFPHLHRSHRTPRRGTVHSSSSRAGLFAKARRFSARSLLPSYKSHTTSVPASPTSTFDSKQFSIFSPMAEHNLTFESKALNSSPACTEKTAEHILQSENSTIPGASYLFRSSQDPLAMPPLVHTPEPPLATEAPPSSFFERFLISAHRSAPARRLGGMGFVGPVSRPYFSGACRGSSSKGRKGLGGEV